MFLIHAVVDDGSLVSRIVVVESPAIAFQYLLKVVGFLVASQQHIFRPQHVSFRHQYVVVRHELPDLLQILRVVVVSMSCLDFQE